MNVNCVICSDLINPAEDIYSTKCGHIFHYNCLIQWMERSKSCPQCRHKLTEKAIVRLFFNFANSEGISEDATTLQSKLDNANFQLRQRDEEIRQQQLSKTAMEEQLHTSKEQQKMLESSVLSKLTTITALKEQLEYVKVQNRETEHLRAERDRLQQSMNMLNGLQKILNGTNSEVEKILTGATDVKTLATFATALKKALMDAESKKHQSRSTINSLKQQLNTSTSTIAELTAKVASLEEKLAKSSEKKKALKRKLKRQLEESQAHEPADEVAVGAKCQKMDDESQTRSFQSSIGVDENIARVSPNVSLNTLVHKIEDSDSPYLSLKQSSVALAALRHLGPPPSSLEQPSTSSNFRVQQLKTKDNRLRPADYGKVGFSIFGGMEKKLNRSQDLFEEMAVASEQNETSYDGLGGHSKPDLFPVPMKKSNLKTFIPKLSAKHRLKRPEQQTTDMTKYIRKLD